MLSKYVLRYSHRLRCNKSLIFQPLLVLVALFGLFGFNAYSGRNQQLDMNAMRADIIRTQVSNSALEVRVSALEGLSTSGKITC